MTQPTEPERYSVEYYIGLLHRHAPDDSPQAFALRAIGAAAFAEYLPEKDRLDRIENILTAIRAITADQLGLDYSREADDPTPVSPARVPLHTGAVVDGGVLIDETLVDAFCSADCADQDDDRPHRFDCPVRLAAEAPAYVPEFGEPGYPGCPGCSKSVGSHDPGCREDES